MLQFYHQLAIKLYKLRWLLLSLALIAFLGFIWLIVAATPAQAQQWQLASIVILLISLFAYLTSLLFLQPIRGVSSQLSLIQRIKIRLQLLFSYLVALLLSVLALTLVFISLRALLVIIRSLYFS